VIARPIPWVSRVRVANYKSIAACDVRLGSLTVLVGPNGVGKSNFLDALAFVAEAVATTPHRAIDARGGLPEMLRRVPGPTGSFSITLDVTVPWGPTSEQWARSTYGFEIAPRQQRGQRSFEIVWEECRLQRDDREIAFRADRGRVSDPSLTSGPLEVAPDRLYLQAASARPDFAPLAVLLSGMSFYNFAAESLRQLQLQSEGALLGASGEHLGDVLGAMADESPGVKQRVDSYMGALAPDLESVERRSEGSYVTVEVRNRTGLDGDLVAFGPEAMSDGTIRAAAALAALFQPAALDGRISLVGIEKPEVALHPAAAGVLFDALTEASERVQVLVTSQSADLLDRDDLDPSIVRAVGSERGLTVIGDVNPASLRALREGRFTAGELLRASQISPDMPAATESSPVRG
jgi:predicted ATPase